MLRAAWQNVAILLLLGSPRSEAALRRIRHTGRGRLQQPDIVPAIPTLSPEDIAGWGRPTVAPGYTVPEPARRGQQPDDNGATSMNSLDLNVRGSMNVGPLYGAEADTLSGIFARTYAVQGTPTLNNVMLDIAGDINVGRCCGCCPTCPPCPAQIPAPAPVPMTTMPTSPMTTAAAPPAYYPPEPCGSSTPACGTATLTAEACAGAALIQVSTRAGFQIGDTISLGGIETAVIAGFYSSNSMTLSAPLQHTYPAGAVIVKGTAPAPMPPPVPPPPPFSTSPTPPASTTDLISALLGLTTTPVATLYTMPPGTVMPTTPIPTTTSTTTTTTTTTTVTTTTQTSTRAPPLVVTVPVPYTVTVPVPYPVYQTIPPTVITTTQTTTAPPNTTVAPAGQPCVTVKCKDETNYTALGAAVGAAVQAGVKAAMKPFEKSWQDVADSIDGLSARFTTPPPASTDTTTTKVTTTVTNTSSTSLLDCDLCSQAFLAVGGCKVLMDGGDAAPYFPPGCDACGSQIILFCAAYYTTTTTTRTTSAAPTAAPTPTPTPAPLANVTSPSNTTNVSSLLFSKYLSAFNRATGGVYTSAAHHW